MPLRLTETASRYAPVRQEEPESVLGPKDIVRNAGITGAANSHTRNRTGAPQRVNEIICQLLCLAVSADPDKFFAGDVICGISFTLMIRGASVRRAVQKPQRKGGSW